MTGDAWVGLDVGTTGVKAVAFDASYTELAAATVPTPTRPLPDGGAEYDADELWAAAAQVLRTVTGALATSGHVARGIAAASMGEAGVLVDGAGRPTAPVIAWFDQRTVPQAAWWAATVGVEPTHAINAIPVDPIFGAPKMLWIQQHWPEAWAAGRHWLNMADWAAYRLSGEMATDHSLASRSMLYDLRRRRWSDELLAASGLDGSRLAPLVQSGRPVGTVTAEASAATGLPPGCVVGAGGQDHICAALALGVTEPGMLLDSIGTAEAFFLVLDDVDASGRLARAGLAQGAHVEAGRVYALAALSDGGGRIDARRAELGLAWDDFLATPEADAVIDELAAEGEAQITTLIETADQPRIRHLATGGGSRNLRLIERKRAHSGRTIEIASQTEATALGAAHLARRAAHQ